ncbi:hypothetical protein ACIQVE_03325, partial [Pseudomonas sp. NPDC098747]|uniref:hypothetical protein n=1 Tax=Pseudomonas sp. NPDC098747 TaxID=3364487 RepID=UPI00383A76A4
PWIKRFMGDPCDEILRNHSKGLRKRFYTLWAESCRSRTTAFGQKRTFGLSSLEPNCRNSSWKYDLGQEVKASGLALSSLRHGL